MIIAVDFDGTLFEDNFPKIGAPKEKIISYIKEHQENGDKIILWTCRANEMLEEALRACDQIGIHFDAVNADLPETLERWGGKETRKITADIYIDDKALNPACV